MVDTQSAPQRSGGSIVGRVLSGVLGHAKQLVSLALIGAILGGLIGYALRLPARDRVVHQVALQFTFSGADRNEYPNGAPFSRTDLLAPLVLEKVFERNKLADYQMDLVGFARVVSVAPYAPGLSFIVDRHRERLSDRKLTVAERKSLEAELSSEFEQTQRRAAILRLSLPPQTTMPRAVAEKILHDIAAVWADTAITTYGVLLLPQAAERIPPLDVKVLASLEPTVATATVEDAIDRLRRRLTALETIGIARSIVDATSGHTVKTLETALGSIIDWQMPGLMAQLIDKKLSRAPVATHALFEQRIAMIDGERQALAKSLVAIERSLAFANTGDPATSRPSAGLSGGNGQASPVPKGDVGGAGAILGERFLDRLVDFVESRSDTTARVEDRRFISKLRSDDYSIRSSIVNLETQRARLQSYQAIAKNAAPQSTPPSTADVDQFRMALATVAQSVNELWTVSSRLFELISPLKMSYSGSLFKQQVLEEPVAFFNPSHRLVMAVTLGTLAGALLGVLALFAWVFATSIGGAHTPYPVVAADAPGSRRMAGSV
jgi:hypothetical protein